MKKLFTLLTMLVACSAISMAETWTVAGSAAALNGDADWSPSNTANDMTLTGDVYTLTVTDCTLEAGTNYEYKVVKDHAWTTAYPGSNKTFTVSETAVYTVVYTFDPSTTSVTETTTKTGEAGAISHTYTVAGSSASLFGSTWAATETANDMAETTTGIYTFTKENVLLDGAMIKFKVAVDHAWGTAYPASDWEIGTSYDEYDGEGYYDVTITFTESTKDIAVELKKHFTGYYLISNEGEGDTWIKGSEMTYSLGEYAITFSKPGKMFAIAPNTALKSDGTVTNWSKVVRPVTLGSDWEVNYFINYNGDTQTVTEGGKVWTVPAGNTANLTLSFDAADNKFWISTDAYETITIGEAGYATYSNAAAYKVMGTGAEAYIVTAASTSATLTKLPTEAELPAGTGIIIKGAAGEYTVEPSNGTADVTGNMLIGSGDYTYNITGDFGDGNYYTGYVLYNDATNGVGFYKVNNSTNNTLSKNKAFLAVPTTGDARDFIGFNFGEATAINAVESAKFNGMNTVYNLAGQRITTPTKGLYIVNGKKVVIK